MATNWIDRQIDDLLLATSVSTGYVYARRRTRRALRRLTRATLLTAGAATAVTAGGVAIAGGALARRHRRRERAMTGTATG
jgi:hypothetical protein